MSVSLDSKVLIAILNTEIVYRLPCLNVSHGNRRQLLFRMGWSSKAHGAHPVSLLRVPEAQEVIAPP